MAMPEEEKEWKKKAVFDYNIPEEWEEKKNSGEIDLNNLKIEENSNEFS